MSSTLVRDARPEEFEAIGTLLTERYAAFGVSDAYLEVLRDVGTRATADRTETLVAVARTTDVTGVLATGVLAYHGSPWAYLAGEGEAELRMLVTAEQAEGQGLGAALVEEVVARARLAGCHTLVLGTMETMTRAHRLYARLGFERLHDRDLLTSSGRPVLVFARSVEPWPLVRPARPDEYDLVGELTVAGYAADGHLARDPDSSYVDELRDAKRRAAEAELYVAVDRTDGRLLGTMTMCPDGSPFREIAHPDEAEFRMLSVSPDARRRGVGEALTRFVLREAHRTGRRGVAMSSASWMTTAHRLYERLGFVRDHARDWTPVPGVSLLAYAREV